MYRLVHSGLPSSRALLYRRSRRSLQRLLGNGRLHKGGSARLDAETIGQLFDLLPETHTSALLKLTFKTDVSEAQWRTALREALESLDWQRQREQIEALICRIAPLETLLPEVYRAWRPIVRDAVAYIGTHLCFDRLAPKLVEQIMLPSDLPLERRLMKLIAQMPSLQKIGQMVARNRNLDPAFRAELIQLENTIQDVEPAAIRAEIYRQLGPELDTYRVVIDDVTLAEASVSAAVRFTWVDPDSGVQQRGVFKVQKPYIREYFMEELRLLQGLAGFLEARRHLYDFAQVRLREIFDDICHLLAKEIDFCEEQVCIRAAAERYAQVNGVRLPRLIPNLCTPTITATTEEAGVKITEAFAASSFQRKQVATRLIEALLAVPLFGQEEEAMFHADPHAGNLFVDEKTGDLILFDWALTERLSREERRQIVRLMLVVALRDERLIRDVITALIQDDESQGQTQGAIVGETVARFIGDLPPCIVPGPRHVLVLIDAMVYAGVRFPRALLVARKVLFTLDGVLHDVAPEVRLTPVLARYALSRGLGSVRGWRRLAVPAAKFRFPLVFDDVIVLYCSALFFGGRLGLQIATQIRDGLLGERGHVSNPAST